MNKHSRNDEKNGWWDSKQREVNEWFRILCLLRLVLGEGDRLPPLSESLLTDVTTNRDWGVKFKASESLLLSLSESLGPTFPLL